MSGIIGNSGEGLTLFQCKLYISLGNIP